MENKILEELKKFFEIKIKPNIKTEGDCWIYLGRTNADGYGDVEIPRAIFNKKLSWRVHRLSYLVHIGQLGDLLVCHTCDVPSCCNPAHLFLGTQNDNMKDMASKGRSANVTGGNNPNVRISEKGVLDIYTSKEYYKILKKRYGLSTYATYAIKQKRTWKELTDLYDSVVFDLNRPKYIVSSI